MFWWRWEGSSTLTHLDPGEGCVGPDWIEKLDVCGSVLKVRARSGGRLGHGTNLVVDSDTGRRGWTRPRHWMSDQG